MWLAWRAPLTRSTAKTPSAVVKYTQPVEGCGATSEGFVNDGPDPTSSNAAEALVANVEQVREARNLRGLASQLNRTSG